MKIAYAIYQDFTALDLIGVYEILNRWPGAEGHFVSASVEPVRADAGLTVTPTDTFGTLQDPDLIVIPGSGRPVEALHDNELVGWIATVGAQAGWATAVCTGSGLLAKAGLLDGREATTHWAFRDALSALGALVVDRRVVIGDGVATAAGVSAGIDMALALTDRIHGRDFAQSAQLAIEYEPEPPFGPMSSNKDHRRQAIDLMLSHVDPDDN